MIGMDFSYYENTKLEQTQYYGILKKNFGKKYIGKFYKKVFNPIYKKYFYTDYVYNWYKNIFLDMVSDTKSNTINCTEGGILFDKNIRNMKLKRLFKKVYLVYTDLLWQKCCLLTLMVERKMIHITYLWEWLSFAQ